MQAKINFELMYNTTSFNESLSSQIKNYETSIQNFAYYNTNFTDLLLTE